MLDWSDLSMQELSAERMIRLSTIVKIANGFGLTASELLDGIVVEDEPLYEVNPIRKKKKK